MRYATIEDTVWPVDDDGEVQWCLRYGLPEAIVERRMQIASFVASYGYLVDPTITQATAIAALKRARRAAGETPQDEGNTV